MEPVTITAINQNDENFIVESKNVTEFEIQCKEKTSKQIIVNWNGTHQQNIATQKARSICLV